MKEHCDSKKMHIHSLVWLSWGGWDEGDEGELKVVIDEMEEVGRNQVSEGLGDQTCAPH